MIDKEMCERALRIAANEGAPDFSLQQITGTSAILRLRCCHGQITNRMVLRTAGAAPRLGWRVKCH